MGKTYFITGSTGLIGKSLVRRLYGEGNKIVVLVRDRDRASKILDGMDAIEFIEGDVIKPVEYTGVVDVIIHSASPTDSRFFVDYPVETIKSVVIGTDHILEFARSKKVESMLYLSSMEVYGVPTHDMLIAEDQYHPIKSTSVRSSYPIAKLMAENLSVSYYSEYAVPVKIVRIAQVIGDKLIEGDNRVISQFVRAAVNGDDINLATDGGSKQSYVSLKDTLDALLLVADKGVDGEAYNISDESMYCSIKELAETVSRVVGEGKTKVNASVGSNTGQYAGYRTLNLDSSKLRGLGWSPSVSIEAALRTLAGIEDDA